MGSTTDEVGLVDPERCCARTTSQSREQILVVPPLECAWLPADGYTIHDSCCMILFEARGTNDVTVLLTSQFGSRRRSWYVGEREALPCHGSRKEEGNIQTGYTIIIGSHRNSCVKIEKNGMVVCLVETPKGANGSMSGHPMHLSGYDFRPFWIWYSCGEIRIGHGKDGGDMSSCWCTWRDVEPIRDIRYVGLSCWDCHVGYRNVRVVPGVLKEEDDVTCKIRMTTEEKEYQMIGMGMCDADMNDAWLIGDTKRDFSMDIDTLFHTCLGVLQREVCLCNVCGILCALDSLSCGRGDGMEGYIAFAAAHIETLCQDEAYVEGFRALPLPVMERIIKHQSIPSSEMIVYNAVRLWAGGDDAFMSAGPGTPTKEMRESSNTSRYNSGADSLLPHVRFPLMTIDELKAIQMSALHSRSNMLQGLVQEALEFHRQPEINGKSIMDPSISVNGVVDRALLHQNGIMRFRQRCPSGCIPLVYMYDGDTNGVCHFIATRYGSQSWANPVSAGLITVAASSPPSRCGTDPKSLVDRNFTRVNFAGPRRTLDGSVESWWMVDLGERHRLRCTRYSLRHDGSSDYLRDWCLQGSVDGVSWKTLISHSNDQTLKMSGQYASWPIRDHGNGYRFRYFKVLQTVPNSSAPNPTHVSLSHFDLYGDFFFH